MTFIVLLCNQSSRQYFRPENDALFTKEQVSTLSLGRHFLPKPRLFFILLTSIPLW